MHPWSVGPCPCTATHGLILMHDGRQRELAAARHRVPAARAKIRLSEIHMVSVEITRGTT